MLFNSFVFIFAFLPAVLIGFHLLARKGRYDEALAWLVLASLFFYGWWKPPYLALLIGSVCFNYCLGAALERRHSKPVLIAGIIGNLGSIGYFKYYNFFVGNLSGIWGVDWQFEEIILPLGISFFTFQQITFLVDAYRGSAKSCGFLRYCLFVTFFPQLVAGPIVHHKEILPQFAEGRALKITAYNLYVGITLFVIGLFKKVVLADNIAPYADGVFRAAEDGVALTFFESWAGSLAYTFQLYFDFSGYSDMAIGLGRMFGFGLPINFFSPYKARNIIEFWRRWHITLSRFLREYLYIPLGGNRKGHYRHYANLMITMFLGGLWHGAGWTFIIWGGLHGLFLCINHSWLQLTKKLTFCRGKR